MATWEITGDTKLQSLWGYLKQLPDRGRLSDLDLKRILAQIVTAVHMSAEVDETGAEDDAELTRKIAAACVALLRTLDLSTMEAVLRTAEWAKGVMASGLHVNFWVRFDKLGMHPTLLEAFRLQRPAVFAPPPPPGRVTRLRLGAYGSLHRYHVLALDGRTDIELVPEGSDMDDVRMVVHANYLLHQGRYLVVRTSVGALVDEIELIDLTGETESRLTFPHIGSEIRETPLSSVIDLLGQVFEVPENVLAQLREFDRDSVPSPRWARS